MADNLLDNYNPLYDIHLRQYFALPHMQKHLQKMGLLESTLNLNGDEVYARHHAMMDMMLKNREAQLVKMADLRKKLDAAEKVEICRRIRTGQSPESYRRGKPSRSLSRNRANQKGSSGGRQRRFSNSYEDRDFVQNIEEKNADPVDYDTRDPYKRLSANAKRFNYLHKLDDKTLIAYKDNLKQQLQRLERFREISFGPHSVARQPPPPQASWFFRRRSLPSLTASAPGNTLKEPLRSVLNMRGRKQTIGNKLNASHDSRTSCPPTTRKRKDSNSRLPPINPKGRVSTKPPAPLAFQQTTTKLPPAAKKPAPTRGRPSNKRQTTTTTTTTITSLSKPPTTPTSLPSLPAVTGHGIFTGAAAAATVAAIGTAAINVESLISDEPQKTPTPPTSPVLETQAEFHSDVPAEQFSADSMDNLNDDSEPLKNDSRNSGDDDEHIAREIVFDNGPISDSHGDYEDSDSEPEYAEEDRELSTVETMERPEIQIIETAETPVVVENREDLSPILSLDNIKSVEQDNEQFSKNDDVDEFSGPLEKTESKETPDEDNIRSPSVLSEENNESSRGSAQGLIEESKPDYVNEHLNELTRSGDDLNTDVSERFEVQQYSSLQGNKHESVEQSDSSSDNKGRDDETTEHQHFAMDSSPPTDHCDSNQQSPELYVENPDAEEYFEKYDAVAQHPLGSIHSVKVENEETPRSPVLSVHSSERDQNDYEDNEAASPPNTDQTFDDTVPPEQHADAVNLSEEKSDYDSLPNPLVQENDIASSHQSTEIMENESSEAVTPKSPVLSANNVEELTTDFPAENTDSDHNNITKPETPTPLAESANEIDHFEDTDVRASENAFAPRSPSVHTSDASDHESELTMVKQDDHYNLLQNHDEQHGSDVENHKETTVNELYNPSNGIMESPQISDDEQGDVRDSPVEVVSRPLSPIVRTEQNGELSPEQGMTIADRINMETYHNSPTKESTSPVVANPLPAHITAEEVAKQLNGPDRTVGSFEEIANQSEDKETDHFESERVNETPAIISDAHQERPFSVENQVHQAEAYELDYSNNVQQEDDLMTASVYHQDLEKDGSQTSLNADPETTTKIKEWDNGDEHVKETITRSEFTDGNTHQSYSKTVTVITEKTSDDFPSPDADSVASPDEHFVDNISTDSMIIHDNVEHADYDMTQSIYEPKEEIEEKEWDDGNKHIHEVVSNVEHTDESGKHFTETVTTTTIIKTGYDAKNNNGEEDEEEHTDQEEKISTITEEDIHGSNGNLKETVTTTTHTVTSIELPKGGILVDDGDETNTSSL